MEAMTSEIEIRGCPVKNNENSASSTTDLYNHVIYNNFNATGVKTQVGVHDRVVAQWRQFLFSQNLQNGCKIIWKFASKRQSKSFLFIENVNEDFDFF